MMNTRNTLRISIFALVLLVLSACKANDDSDSGGHSWNGAGGNGAPPTIWGDPNTNVLVNSQYVFVPEASDPDGDVLDFSIANKPAWAEFDASSGRLQGVPGSDYMGEARGIVISVADNHSIVSLSSFSISVRPQLGPRGADTGGSGDDGSGDDGSGGGASGGGSGGDGGSGDGSSGDGGVAVSAPPTISGQANKSAVIGNVYAFQPISTDPDGDALSFSIVNKPSWASFDTTSGQLEGTPAMSDLGESAPIELSVTDGTSIAGLAPFTISVEAAGPSSYSLAWIPPTQNADGTPLTDLAGYRIYYGTSSGKYSETIKLDSPGMTSYVIENLTQGNYFLVMTSVNSRDVESAYTPELNFNP